MSAVGIDLGGTQIKAVLVSPGGEVLRRELRATNDGEPRGWLAGVRALECFIGNYNIRERTGGRFETTHALIAAFRDGDPFARERWLESIRALACAIASFVNILDPEAVILGGGIAQAGGVLLDPLREELAKVEWRPAGAGVKLLPAALGEWAGAIGAARVALLDILI